MPEKAVVLDANLLVLLAVGIASQHHIATHKRLGGYSKADFDLLRSLLARASRIVVTPNTPTEAVNLSAHIAEPIRTSIKQAFRQLLTKTEEIYVESARASRHVAFFRLESYNRARRLALARVRCWCYATAAKGSERRK